jgi:hypothetical protein
VQAGASVQREQAQDCPLADRAERNRLPVTPGRERSQYLDPEAAASDPVVLSGGAAPLPGARGPRPSGTAPVRGGHGPAPSTGTFRLSTLAPGTVPLPRAARSSGIMPDGIMSVSLMPAGPLPGGLICGGPLPGSRSRGADQFLVLIGGQPQYRGQPVQRLPPWPPGPALLEVLQRAEADPGPAGQLPLG